jgi:lysophospholipase L1-like esterase
MFGSSFAVFLLLMLVLTGCSESAEPGATEPSDDEGRAEVDDDEPPARPDATVLRDAGRVDGSKVDASKPDASNGEASENDASEVEPQAPDADLPDAGARDASPQQDASPSDAAAPVDASSGFCELAPYQVGLLGDSYINLSGDVTRFLQENARKAGALGATETYIDKSKSGAAMQKSNLLAPAIPTQLPTLLADSKRLGDKGVKLVVMTGGGNDVLIDASQCKTISTPTEECKAVVGRTLTVVDKLFADMNKAGIEHVIYFWYPDLGPSGGKVINDYSVPLVKEHCESSTEVTCHFVDTREPFRGHPEYVAFDNIHPTAAGSKVIADLVWEVMVDNCLGSK